MGNKIIALALLLMCAPVFASSYYQTNADTFMVGENYGAGGIDAGTIFFNITNYYGNLSEYVVYFIKSGGSPLNSKALVKFYTDYITTGLIQNAQIAFTTETNNCNSYFGGYFLNNNSWNDTPTGMPNYSYVPAIDTTMRIKNSTGGNGILPSAGDASTNLVYPSLGNAYLLNSLYSNNETSIATDNTVGSCGSTVGNRFTIKSREKDGSVRNTSIKIDYTNYLNGTSNNTDVNDFVEFDFESGYASKNAFFTPMDFEYLASTNIITPNSGQGVTQALYPYYNGVVADDVSNFVSDCAHLTNYASTPISPYVVQNSYYTFICFNLSARHNGNPTYAMIKIINNTNVKGNASVDFDFYYGVSTNTFNAFFITGFVPDPFLTGLNATVLYATTIPMTTYAHVRYNNSGAWSPFMFLVGAGTGAEHSFTINSQLVFPVNYQYYFDGTDSLGNNYTSGYFNFTVSGLNPITGIVNGTTLPSALQGLVDSGVAPNFAWATWIFGSLIIMIATIAAWKINGGGLAFDVAITFLSVLSLIGFLPIWLMIPVIIYVAFRLSTMFAHGIGGRGSS